jgi:hypothetical protein
VGDRKIQFMLMEHLGHYDRIDSAAYSKKYRFISPEKIFSVNKLNEAFHVIVSVKII